MNISTNPWVWVAAIMTIAVFSYLWKENKLYRLAEHIFIGISMGYIFIITWNSILLPRMWNPLVKEHSFSLLIPIILGALLFFRFTPKLSWLSFWPLAFLIGFTGYAIPASIDANLLKQMQATIMLPMNDWVSIANGMVIILGTLACLLYFHFSIPHQGVVGHVAKTGSMILMISFGASFGLTVMARISLLIGRIMFLFKNWLGMIN